LSFYYLHVRSGLWRLTHGKTEVLDEREVQLTREAFRRSYSVLTMTTLCLVFFIFLTVRFSFLTLTHRGDYSLGLIVTMALNYLFNTLPASLIAWHESPGKE
ncbi:MAG: hypothetical protein JW843_06890, partial [Candidatus Aminicenantes bacterium]|nr:hypothetical protein [Candidatus Aminicenantes bacterium]